MANRTVNNPRRVLIDSEDGTRARFCLIGDHLGIEIMQDGTCLDISVSSADLDLADARALRDYLNDLDLGPRKA